MKGFNIKMLLLSLALAGAAGATVWAEPAMEENQAQTEEASETYETEETQAETALSEGVPITIISDALDVTDLIWRYWENDFEQPELMALDDKSSLYYQTKRIIIYTDNLTETYGAVEALYYPEFGEYILQYDTESATEAAYEKLLQLVDDPAYCFVDQILGEEILAEEYASETVDSMAYINNSSWGAAFTGMEAMKSDTAFSGAAVQKVAIIDSGINPYNSWFSGHVISSDSYDFAMQTSTMTDLKGHGTATASVVVSCTGANVQVMALKVYNSLGQTSWELINNAMQYAITHKASVINMSFGTYGGVSKAYVEKSVDTAYSQGIPVICAAGNECMDVNDVYPANLARTIAVSALDKNLEFDQSYSDYGSMVDFCAPGTEILCAIGNSVSMMSGTSFSAPMTAAAFTYYKTLNPGASVSTLYNYAKSMAIDLGTAGKDNYYGWGCISVVPTKSMTVKAEGTDQNHIRLSWTDNSGADGYLIYTDKGGRFEYVGAVTEKQYVDACPFLDEVNYYQVFAYKMSGNRRYIVNAARTIPKAMTLLPPAANFTAVSQDLRKVSLSWSGVAGAKEYLVYVQRNGVRSYLGKTSRTTLTDNNALYADYNFYWVYPYSYINGVKRTGTCTKYVFAKGRLQAVTNLRGYSQKGGVRLTWNPVAGADGYLVYGIVDGKPYQYVGMTTQGTTFTDKKASSAQYNFYWVYPYYRDASGKMYPGGVCKYTYGKAL